MYSKVKKVSAMGSNALSLTTCSDLKRVALLQLIKQT